MGVQGTHHHLLPGSRTLPNMIAYFMEDVWSVITAAGKLSSVRTAWSTA